MWSTHSRRIDPISRSAKPFCQGEAAAVGFSRSCLMFTTTMRPTRWWMKSRLADSNPQAAAEILERMLDASAPTYDLDDKLKKLIEKLAALDLRDAAFRCAEKVRKTRPGMLDLYKKLANPN
jgi:hypothetical protein